MIWYATTKDIMGLYAEEFPVDEVIETDYLIFSSRIQCTIPRKNVLNIYTHFMSVNVLKGLNLKTDPKSDKAAAEFKHYLMRQPNLVGVLVSILKSGLSNRHNIIFLVTPSELKTGNIVTFCKVIKDVFAYDIRRFPDVGTIDEEECLKRLIHYEQESETQSLKRIPRDIRETLLKDKGRGELKGFLKDRNLYEKGMSEEEMVEIIMNDVCGDGPI